MATVIIQYETKEKNLTVSIDGEKVDDVHAVYIYHDKESYGGYSEYGSIEIVKSTKLDNGMSVYTRIVGSDSEKGQKAKASGNGEFSKDKTLVVHFDEKDIAALL